MKFKHFASWSVALILTGISITSAVGDPIPLLYNEPDFQPLTIKTDTIKISEVPECGHILHGKFVPQTNTIILYYMISDNDNPRIQKICNNNNINMPLTLQHEKEHARKALMMRNNRNNHTPRTRAAIAIQNEMMAPAAEIIAALEYHAFTGKPFPTSTQFIKQADKNISEITGDNIVLPFSLTDSRIADEILEAATQKFLAAYDAGAYRETIIQKMNDTISGNYIPNTTCAKCRTVGFAPELDFWYAMWDFNTTFGPVNIWAAASESKRQKILAEMNMIIDEITGQNAYFFKNQKTR